MPAPMSCKYLVKELLAKSFAVSCPPSLEMLPQMHLAEILPHLQENQQHDYFN